MSTTEKKCLLKLTNITLLQKFLHQCVDELIGREQQIINTIDDVEWTPEEQKIASNFIQNLYKTNIFEEEFTLKLEDLSSTHIDEIKTCFDIRKDEIYAAVIKEQLLMNNIPLVDNIDWKIKWVIGSSKLATFSEPLVQVDLNCISNEKTKSKECNVIQFEANLSQVDKLIEGLENVKLQF